MTDLTERAHAASAALHGLHEETREADRPAIERLERIVAYVTFVLSESDSDLLAAGAETTVGGAFDQITAEVEAGTLTARTHIETLLTAIATVPVAGGRIDAQGAKDIAADFQRAASEREATLSREIEATQATVAELREEVDRLRSEAVANATAATEAVRAEATTISSELATAQQTFTALAEQQTTSFDTAEAERVKQANETAEARATAAEEAEQTAQERMEELVAEIIKMRDDSKKLVGEIGLAGTADRYRVDADGQGGTANKLRIAAFVIAALALIPAALVGFDVTGSDRSDLARGGLALVLAGLATYAGKQSGRHRDREERFRLVELQLTAFQPFTTSLTDEQRQQATLGFVERIFPGDVPALRPDDGGPTLAANLPFRNRAPAEPEPPV